MGMILDMAIALTLKDMVTGSIGNIINEFKNLEGVTEDVKSKLNDFKNIGAAGGALFSAGAFGLDKTLDILNEVTNEAASFEDSMVVLMNKSFGKNLIDPSYKNQVEEVKAYFSDAAMEIGAGTTFNSTDILDSMTELVKGGIDYVEVIDNVAKANAYFAQVNRVAATATAEGTVQMKEGFGLVGDEVMQGMELINQYADATIADSLALQRALGNVAGTASSIWGSRNRMEITRDTVALTAITTNVLGDESRSATDVKNFLNRANMTVDTMSKPQKEAMKAAGWLDTEGHSVFIDYENGMLKDAAEMQKIIKETQQSLSDVQFANLLKTVFREQGSPVAAALANAADLGTAGIDDIVIEGTLRYEAESALSIADQVEIEMGRFNAVKDTFSENIANFKKIIGAPFLEPGKVILRGLSEQIEKATEYFKQHPEVTKFIFTLAGGLSVFLMITGAIMGVIGAVGSLKLIWGIAGKAIMGAMTPVIGTMLPVMAVVAGIAAAGYLIYKNWGTVGPIFKDIGDVIKNTFTLITSIFSGSIDTDAGANLIKLIERFGFSSEQARSTVQRFTEGVLAVKNVFIIIKNAVVSIISVLFRIISTTFNNILKFLEQNAGFIWQVIISVWNVISAFLTPVLNLISFIITTAFNEISDFISKWGPTISSIFTNAFILIFAVAKIIFERLQVFWETWGPTIIAIFEGTLNLIKTTFETTFIVIRYIVGYVIGTISNIINFVLAIISGDWEGAWNAIKDQFELWKETVCGIVDALAEGFEKAFTIIKNTVNDIFTNLIESATGMVETISNDLGNLKDKALEWGINLVIGFSDGISSTLQKINNVLIGASEAVNNALGGLKDKAVEMGINLITGFSDGISSTLQKILDALVGATEAVNNSLGSLKDKALEWGTNLIINFSDGISLTLQKIIDALFGVTEAVGNSLGGLKDKAIEWGINLLTGFTDGIFANLQKIPETLFEVTELISNTFSGLVSKALEWGSNLITSFTDGIYASLQKIPDTLKGAAETVKSWLGIASPTKEGPLRHNHLWGGNLIKSLASGMINTLPVLESSVKQTSKTLDSVPKSFGYDFEINNVKNELMSVFDLRNDFKEWGGNLIKSFADGMIGSFHLLKSAASLASGNIDISGNSSVRLKPVNEIGSSGKELYSPVYIQIYPSPNHDAEKIADNVIKKLKKQNRGKTHTSKSSLVMSPNGYKGGY